MKTTGLNSMPLAAMLAVGEALAPALAQTKTIKTPPFDPNGDSR